MDVVFGWIFVSTFLSKVIQIESSLAIIVGTFRVLRKHPRLRQCAGKDLRKHLYVGARISDQTGVCEGLPHFWGRNQTIESGYGYVENVHMRTNFEPPLEAKSHRNIIPGVLNTGAKIDIHLTWIKEETTAFYIHLHETKARSVHCLRINCHRTECYIGEFGNNAKTILSNPDNTFHLPHQLSASDQWKVSFVAQRNTVDVLAGDEVLLKYRLIVDRLNYMKYVSVSTTNAASNIPRIHSIEFTNA